MNVRQYMGGKRPGVAQRVGRGVALLFHDPGTRRGWVVSSTPRPHFTPGKDPVPIVQEAGCAPEPVWTGGKSRPHRDSIPDRPARSSVAISTELPGPQYRGGWKYESGEPSGLVYYSTFRGPCIVMYSYNKSQRDKVLYMFRTGPLSTIRSIPTLYTRNRYLSC
jgi:hypothetical protein